MQKNYFDSKGGPEGGNLAAIFRELKSIRRNIMKYLVFYMALVLTLVFAGSAHATGNGAPSGSHYNLNIICVPNGKTADMTGTQGHTIFVPCGDTTKINLIEGPDFEVLDRNGTDGQPASSFPSRQWRDHRPARCNDECTRTTPMVRSIRMALLTQAQATTTSAAAAPACTPSSPARSATRGTAAIMLCGETDDGIEVQHRHADTRCQRPPASSRT
jgi:hypothetical protein